MQAANARAPCEPATVWRQSPSIDILSWEVLMSKSWCQNEQTTCFRCSKVLVVWLHAVSFASDFYTCLRTITSHVKMPMPKMLMWYLKITVVQLMRPSCGNARDCRRELSPSPDCRSIQRSLRWKFWFRLRRVQMRKNPKTRALARLERLTDLSLN